MEEKHRVGIYVRVSTNNQVEDGYSIGEQTDKLKKYCDIKDWENPIIYTDGGYSGSSLNRPGIERLVHDVKKHKIDTVIVYKLDRLSRSQKDTLFLIEDVFNANDCNFISLNENFDTSTAFGKAMIGILSVFAQLEREQITQRMQMGRVGRAKAGYFNGSVVPFGYNYKDGLLVVNEGEASVVNRIFQLYLDGNGILKIANILNDEGHPYRDNLWNLNIIRNILKRRTYVGEVSFKKQWYPGLQEPIIDKETFDEVQKQYDRRSIEGMEKSNNTRPFRAKYMLSGLIRCGKCGSSLEIQVTKRANGTIRNYYYICRKKSKTFLKMKGLPLSDQCDLPNIKKDDVESRVLSAIVRLSWDKKRLDNLLNKRGVIREDPSPLEKTIRENNKKISKLMDLYSIDSISMDNLNSKISKYNIENERLKKRIENIEKEQTNKSTAKIKYLFSKAENIIKNGSYQDKMKLVHQLVKEVDVNPSNITIKWLFN